MRPFPRRRQRDEPFHPCAWYECGARGADAFGLFSESGERLALNGAEEVWYCPYHSFQIRLAQAASRRAQEAEA